jgi:hypothetical protein
MTLGYGSFGPPLKTEHTEKSWPPTDELEIEYHKCGMKPYDSIVKNEVNLMIESFDMAKEPKFYGAEWIDETDN